jgi:hypothetical protein
MNSMIIPATEEFSIEDLRIRERMRKVYSDEYGREELLNYLIEMGMFSEITPEELPLRNMAVKKIQQLGFLDVETVVDTIAFLMNRPSILRKVTGKTPKESTDDE